MIIIELYGLEITLISHRDINYFYLLPSATLRQIPRYFINGVHEVSFFFFRYEILYDFYSWKAESIFYIKRGFIGSIQTILLSVM